MLQPVEEQPDQSRYSHYKQTPSIGIGGTHIALGCLVVICHLAAIGISPEYGTFYGQGIWIGALYILTGAFGVAAGKTLKVSHVVASLVLSIVSIVFNFALLGFNIAGMIIGAFDSEEEAYGTYTSINECYPDPNIWPHSCDYNSTIGNCTVSVTANYTCVSYIYHEYDYTSSDKQFLIPLGVMIFVNGVQFFIAVSQSILGCIGHCCEGHPKPQEFTNVSGQPVGYMAPASRMYRLPTGECSVILQGLPTTRNGTLVSTGPTVTPASCGPMIAPPYSALPSGSAAPGHSAQTSGGPNSIDLPPAYCREEPSDLGRPELRA